MQNEGFDDYLLSHLSPRRAGIVEREPKQSALLKERVERIEELEKELAEISGSRAWRYRVDSALDGRGSAARAAVDGGWSAADIVAFAPCITIRDWVSTEREPSQNSNQDRDCGVGIVGRSGRLEWLGEVGSFTTISGSLCR